MGVELDFSDDWQVWDATEQISFVSVGSREARDQYEVTALRRAVSEAEQAASGGAYTTQDLTWIVPKSQLVGVTPKPADKVVDVVGASWKVLRVSYETMRSVWKLTTRNLRFAYQLYDLVSLFRPLNTQDPALTRKPQWIEAAYGIQARIQPISTGQTDERGRRGDIREYQIFLDYEDIGNVTTEWKVRGEDGEEYEITGVRNAFRIDELPVIEARRTP